jgi:hypothetical protein
MASALSGSLQGSGCGAPSGSSGKAPGQGTKPPEAESIFLNLLAKLSIETYNNCAVSLQFSS